MISAGVVAKPGTARKIGAKRIERAKRAAAVTAVRPVLPPAATPEADSTKVVVVEVPKTAPTEVATASAQSAPEMRGRRPSLSRKPPFSETPMSVPSVSKRSTKKKANITTKKSSDLISAQPEERRAPSLAVCFQASAVKRAPAVWPNSEKDSPMPAKERRG